VLEINSSDKRCGRLVLEKVGEATRSQSLLKRYVSLDMHVCFLYLVPWLKFFNSATANEGTLNLDEASPPERKVVGAGVEKRRAGRPQTCHDSSPHPMTKDPGSDQNGAAALIFFEEIEVLLEHDRG
jgi:hypothetical protein